jgi:hypothetical protein
MVINHNLNESQSTRKSEIVIQIATTIIIQYFMLLATITLNMMIHIKRRKKFSEEFSSKNVQEKMKRGICNIILQAVVHKLQLEIKLIPSVT